MLSYALLLELRLGDQPTLPQFEREAGLPVGLFMAVLLTMKPDHLLLSLLARHSLLCRLPRRPLRVHVRLLLHREENARQVWSRLGRQSFANRHLFYSAPDFDCLYNFDLRGCPVMFDRCSHSNSLFVASVSINNSE